MIRILIRILNSDFLNILSLIGVKKYDGVLKVFKKHIYRVEMSFCGLSLKAL